MNNVTATRRNNEKLLDLGSYFWIDLAGLSSNRARFTIEQIIRALQATTTMGKLGVCFARGYVSTPENSRRVVEPLCRCIANLRRHNPNHPLRHMSINHQRKMSDDDTNEYVDRDVVDQFLVAAKQYGIQHLSTDYMRLRIQSFVDFCRNNIHLKVLTIHFTILSDEEPTLAMSPQFAGSQDSSAILALDELKMSQVKFKNSTAATKFIHLMARVTYTVLNLGEITVAGNDGSDDDPKITLIRFVSEIIKPSVEELTLHDGCRVEYIDAIEACATVTRVERCDYHPPNEDLSDDVLQPIASRNHRLDRFLANPCEYPVDQLLALMRQFDRCQTGRYMLACGLVGIPSFFEIESTNSTNDVQENPCSSRETVKNCVVALGKTHDQGDRNGHFLTWQC